MSIIKKRSSLLTLFLLFSTYIYSENTLITQPCNPYLAIAPLYLPCFGPETKPETMVIAKTLKEALDLFKLKQVVLAERQKREIGIGLYASQPQKESKNITTLDKTFLKKIELFNGGEQSTYNLLSILTKDTGITTLGEIALAGMLVQPTVDVEKLTANQNIIHKLTTDAPVLTAGNTYRNALKEHENALLAYYLEGYQHNEQLFQTMYYNIFFKEKLNTSPIALGIGYRINNLMQTAALLMGPTFTYYSAKEILGYRPPILGFSLAQNQYLANEVSARNILFSQLPSHQQAALGIMYAIYNAGTNLISYASYRGMTLSNDISKHLQTNLTNIAQYLNNLKKIYELTQQHEELKHIPGLEHIAYIFDPASSASPSLKKLIKLLDTKTFTSPASFFSKTGRILAAHRLLREVKNELIPALIASGNIDAYFSLATLVKSFEQKRVGFCFVTFIDGQKPYIKATEFWNPFVNPEVVVTNSIELGGNAQPNNIILTGPNTGGKSTLIKGLIINLLLAQTFGIAPAQEFFCTPFANINCYLNITDDIATGVSLFKAEALRAKELIENIRKLKPHEFSFTIMDEVFSGTEPTAGAHAALLYANELGLCNNSMCCIATHFPILTQLEKGGQITPDIIVPGGLFKNYHVSVSKNPDGSWLRPFKMEAGISTNNIAMDLLEEEGIFSIRPGTAQA